MTSELANSHLHAIKTRFFANPLGDLLGGLMAAIVALPLCLAFGVASGLGPAAGLYGAIACGIFAAVFGGTPAQCSGPTGPMTVVAASIMAASPNHPNLVFAAVMFCGLFQLALGFFKAGQLIHYIPYPVISGFMTGIGAIIICIELGPILGERGSGGVLQALHEIPKVIANPNPQACMISIIALLIIYLLPKISKRIPATLLALLGTTILSCMLNLDIPRIGTIPESLPLPRIPHLSFTDLNIVIQNGLTLALLGAIDTLLTSLVMDKVSKGRHDSDQELIGQGIGNMMASFVGGLPCAGATMRSMVNVKAGGKTYLSGAVHGLILLFVLLGMGKVAGQIPQATLAAILLSVGLSIMDWRVLKGVKQAPRQDTIVMVTVLALTMFVDLIIAVLVGVALSSVLFVKQLADAKVSSVGSFETLEELRSLTEHVPESVRKAIYTYQFNGPLFFGEAKNLASTVDKLTQARYIILRFYNVPFVDQTGAYALEDAVEKWESKGIRVLFVGMQNHVRQILEDTGVIHKIDIQNCFDQYEDAIFAIDTSETTSNKEEVQDKVNG